MSQNAEEKLGTSTYAAGQAAEDRRDVVLAGVALPPSEIPLPLQASLVPRASTALDLPARIPPRRAAKFTDDTETMLNAMIGDCHFLMREVAYRCAVQSSDAVDRLSFLRGALGCAETGAKLADSIARLRAIPFDEDRRTAILLEANRILEDEKSAKQ